MKKLNNTEKGMIFMILLFIIGILVRWDFISTQVVSSIRNILSW